MGRKILTQLISHYSLSQIAAKMTLSGVRQFLSFFHCWNDLCFKL